MRKSAHIVFGLVILTFNAFAQTFPSVSVVASDSIATEPGSANSLDTGTFTITREGSTNLPLLVFFTLSGTASNGVDFVKLDSPVTIPQGARAVMVPIVPFADNLAEGEERVILRLAPSPLVGPADGYVLPTNRISAVVVIRDGDPTNAPPVVTIVTPTNGTVFKAPANVPITADTVDRDGYVSRVEFYANGFKIGEASKAFFVAPPPGEHISYDFEWKDARAGRYLLTARGFDDQGVVGFSAPVEISILGTNVPPTNVAIVSISAPDANASEHETNTATFVIRREGNTNLPLQVFYSPQGTASNGIDYITLPGSAIIPAGERAVRIVVVPINDLIPEPMESVVLALLPPPVMNSLPGYVVGLPARAAAVIADDDGPRQPAICLHDGVFSWCRLATNGQCFRIECSSDLVTWTELCTTQVTENAIHYADADAPAALTRFYRAIAVPCPADGL